MGSVPACGCLLSVEVAATICDIYGQRSGFLISRMTSTNTVMEHDMIDDGGCKVRSSYMIGTAQGCRRHKTSSSVTTCCEQMSVLSRCGNESKHISTNGERIERGETRGKGGRGVHISRWPTMEVIEKWERGFETVRRGEVDSKITVSRSRSTDNTEQVLLWVNSPGN